MDRYNDFQFMLTDKDFLTNIWLSKGVDSIITLPETLPNEDSFHTVKIWHLMSI